MIPNTSGSKRAWLLNVDTRQYTRLPELNENRWEPAVGVVEASKIMVTGGHKKKTTEIFDLRRNTWTRGPNLPVKSELKWTSTVSYGGSFIIVGGYDEDKYVKSLITFDTRRNNWVIMSQQLATGKHGASAIMIPSNYVSCSNKCNREVFC